ncbi:MAG: ABC transporter ATP-binding protein/permease [Oscillospiraceae bacterium]|jgi:ATP-binding cassette subfamily B protein|nr:ABC transporter ATP-binding protein/permease [Oscillospiraceae bacterium]
MSDNNKKPNDGNNPGFPPPPGGAPNGGGFPPPQDAPVKKGKKGAKEVKFKYTDENFQPQGRGGPGGPGGGPPGRGMPVQKPKNMKQAWKDLLSYARRFVPIMVFAMLCSLAGVIIQLVGPTLLGDITNQISIGLQPNTQLDLDKIVKAAQKILALYIGSTLLSSLQGFSMVTVSQKLSQMLRSRISKKVNRLPLSYFDTTTVGNTLSRVTNDVDTLAQTLNQSVVSAITAVTTFLGAIFMMYRADWILATAAIVSTIGSFVFVRMIMRRTQPYFRANQRLLAEINGHVEEIYSAHNIVKAFNGEKDAIDTFENLSGSLYDANWKSQFLSGLMMPLMNFIGNIGYVVVCILGTYMFIQGRIEFGIIVAFMMYIRMFTQPMQQMALVLNWFQSTAAAAERTFDFLGEDELSPEADDVKHIEPANIRGDVSFNHVHFGYNAERTIINDFSVDVKAGQKVAIVGPTGAGKTTMVNLLMRFYETNSGFISIDGIPTNKLTRENVHDLFCMVLQDTWLFEGTIKENVVYSMKNVSDQKVIDACVSVGMDHFIRTLPQGYNTELSDNVSLSAGQKQLLTIARAMIEDAPLLILDEATSSVDTRTEVLVQQSMDKLTHGRTSFVIAHRLSTVKNSDLILVMKDGDIIESGSHDELIAQNGFYADLYNSQFEEKEDED